MGDLESSSDENMTAFLLLAADRLERTAGRNFDWQFNHKHRTRAWRGEVERRLGQLGIKLEAESNAEQSPQRFSGSTPHPKQTQSPKYSFLN